MNFKEYEEKAITTRVYSPKVAMSYTAFGLCGETGEFFEKLINHDMSTGFDPILKEVGDMLWYVAAIRVEFDLKPLEWPLVTQMNGADGFLVQSNVGVVAEQMKKYLRDDWKEDVEVVFPEERKEKIHGALCQILEKMQAICIASFSVNLQKIAADNIEKLAKRKENNCLHGSGDERTE